MVAIQPRHALSVLVITEDTGAGAHAHEALVALLKRTFALLCSGVATHRIDFEPASEEARRAMQGAKWKTRQPEDHQSKVKLHRTIARKLVEPAEAPGFVVFHVDGDRPWSKRKDSENLAKLDDLILAIRQLVAATVSKEGRDGDVSTPMARLLVWMPFYSIEAWLYQSTDEARRLCHATGCGRHDAILKEWTEDRGALDELECPKDALCLESKHHPALAKTFPAEMVRAAEKSYAWTVAALERCPGLQVALAGTWMSRA